MKIARCHILPLQQTGTFDGRARPCAKSNCCRQTAVLIEQSLRAPVSQKWEYSRTGPETFGALAPQNREIGSWRPAARSQKPVVCGPFSRSLETCRDSRTGWLAMQCRSHQSPAKFPANREVCREIPIFSDISRDAFIAKSLSGRHFSSNSLRELTGKLFRAAGNLVDPCRDLKPAARAVE